MGFDSVIRFLLIVMIAFLGISSAHASVKAVGLFQDFALLVVGGEQKLVKKGETFKGVTLIRSDSKGAVVEIDGEVRSLSVSRGFGKPSAQSAGRQVSLTMNNNRQYITSGQINGRPTSFLIDTGANTVAISKTLADGINIDYLAGTPVKINTASGESRGYRIKLFKVRVGPIELYNVDAVVSDNDFPRTPLLGMSFLQRLDVAEKGGILTLKKN